MFDYFHATPAQWREVLPRLFVPERRREEAARAALRGTRGVREGWELLFARGVLSERWASSLERRFVPHQLRVPSVPLSRTTPSLGARTELAFYRSKLSELPPGLGDALTWAADVEALPTAELLACEARERLRRWGARVGNALLLRTMDLRSPDPWLHSWWEHTYEAQLRGRRSYPVRADTEAERLVHNWLYNLWSRLPAKAAASVGRSIAESISLALRWRVLQREQAFLSREALLASRPRGEELERWDESAVETLATTPLEELRDVGEVQVALLHMGYSLGRFSEEGLELRTPRLALRHH